MPQNRLVVFGDSHSVIWSGTDVLGKVRSLFPNVHIRHLGPALAYNLLDESGEVPGKWGRKIIETINDFSGWDISYIMLCFGEIDARTQAIYRAVSEDISIAESASLIACRIVKFAEILEAQFRIPILICEPVPSSSDKNFSFNPRFPAVGSEKERNLATYNIALTLRSETQRLQQRKKSIFCFGAYEQLTRFHETRVEYFDDGCHLNLAGLEVSLQKLRDLDHRFNLNASSFFEVKIDSTTRAKLTEVSELAKLTLSSKYIEENCLQKTERGFCFHTNLDQKPWALIDLGYSMNIDSIELSNRIDSEQSRAKTLAIHAGNDPNELVLVYSFIGQRLLAADPNSARIKFSSSPVRFISFSLSEKNYLHLGWVKIYTKLFYNQ